MTVCILPRRAALVLLVATLATAIGACSGDDGGSPSGTPSASATTPAAPTATPTQAPLSTLQPRTPISFSEPAVLYGAESDDLAGAVAAGDFNGDGELDIVLGAAFADGPDNALADAGEAYIFFGPFTPGEERDAGAGEQDATLYGSQEGDQTGHAIASGDVTGDGIDDVILGAPAPHAGRPGTVYIVPGRSVWPETLQLPGDEPLIRGADRRDFFGFSIEAGDATGDGIADILASSFGADGPGESRIDAGEVYLIPGSASWPELTDLGSPPAGVVTFAGAEAEGRVGENVALADMTGDGVQDLVLSETFASGPDGAELVGAVYVIAGGEGLAGQDLRNLEPLALGFDDGDQLGHSVASGDVDGDGSLDLLLGAVSADGPGNQVDLAGEVHVLFNAGAQLPDRPDGPERTIIYGGASVNRVGRSVASGDLDGDGRADLLLAAPGADETSDDDNTGRLFIIFGREELPGALQLKEGGYDLAIAGRDPGDALGTSLSGKLPVVTADFDGDGGDDIVVASLGDGPANDRSDAGEVSLFFAADP